jgi:hypothetical protein
MDYRGPGFLAVFRFGSPWIIMDRLISIFTPLSSHWTVPLRIIDFASSSIKKHILRIRLFLKVFFFARSRLFFSFIKIISISDYVCSFLSGCMFEPSFSSSLGLSKVYNLLLSLLLLFKGQLSVKERNKLNPYYRINFISNVNNLNSSIFYFNTACVGYKSPPHKGKHLVVRRLTTISRNAKNVLTLQHCKK